MKICILAAGTWGVALAKVLCAENDVCVWSISKEEIDGLNATHMHKNLPEVLLPENIEYTTDIEKAVKNAEFIILATPSLFVRSTTEKIKPFVKKDQIIVCVAKGIEEGTLFTMSEIIDDVLEKSNPVVALSGPTHAEEVALDMPTLIVAASNNLSAAGKVQILFQNTCIRAYTNCDIKGVEICGALKNIIALACGIATGLGFGDNTRAALMTRGMAEIKNLGLAMGCLDETFSGLAGIGDLIVTATSEHSRNNKAGRLIGGGMTPEKAVETVGMVVEGMNALPAAMELSKKYSVELPIITAVENIVNNKISAKDAVTNLLSRRLRSEHRLPEEEVLFEKELLHFDSKNQNILK